MSLDSEGIGAVFIASTSSGDGVCEDSSRNVFMVFSSCFSAFLVVPESMSLWTLSGTYMEFAVTGSTIFCSAGESLLQPAKKRTETVMSEKIIFFIFLPSKKIF